MSGWRAKTPNQALQWTPPADWLFSAHLCSRIACGGSAGPLSLVVRLCNSAMLVARADVVQSGCDFAVGGGCGCNLCRGSSKSTVVQVVGGLDSAPQPNQA